jgi:hypothetical protein
MGMHQRLGLMHNFSMWVWDKLVLDFENVKRQFGASEIQNRVIASLGH